MADNNNCGIGRGDKRWNPSSPTRIKNSIAYPTKMAALMSTSMVCFVIMLLTVTALAHQHLHRGDLGGYSHHHHHHGMHDNGKKDHDGGDDFNIKAYKGDSHADYTMRKNSDNVFGVDQHSQGSSKDAAARKHSKAATVNKNHDKKLKKERENKAASKNSHDKTAASASARKKERSAQASKKHAKKYSRAKNINIYSKKASDVTHSFEDNTASAKSTLKDAEAKKAGAKDKGSNAALRSNETELKLSSKGNSNAASSQQSNAAHVKTAAKRKGKSGRKSKTSKGSHAFLKRTRPSSFTKRAVHSHVAGHYGLGDLQRGSFSSIRVYPVGGVSASNSYSIGTFGMKGERSLPSNTFGVGSRAMTRYADGMGATSSSSGQTIRYSQPSRPGGIVLGSSSGSYGVERQSLDPNTFGIGDDFMRRFVKSDRHGSMTRVGGGMPVGPMTSIRVGSESYGRPVRRARKSGLTVDAMGSASRIGVGRRGYGQKGTTTRFKSVDSFGSFESDFFDDFRDDDDDDDLFNVDYGSTGFGDGW